MLDISFYSKNGNAREIVEVTEDFYKSLYESDFSKIGKSVPRILTIDDETVKLEVVQLTKNNRQKLKMLFLEGIADESDRVISMLGSSPSKQEVHRMTSRLAQLQELRKCIDDDRYQFMQRV